MMMMMMMMMINRKEEKRICHFYAGELVPSSKKLHPWEMDWKRRKATGSWILLFLGDDHESYCHPFDLLLLSSFFFFLLSSFFFLLSSFFFLLSSFFFFLLSSFFFFLLSSFFFFLLSSSFVFLSFCLSSFYFWSDTENMIQMQKKEKRPLPCRARRELMDGLSFE